MTERRRRKAESRKTREEIRKKLGEWRMKQEYRSKKQEARSRRKDTKRHKIPVPCIRDPQMAAVHTTKIFKYETFWRPEKPGNSTPKKGHLLPGY